MDTRKLAEEINNILAQRGLTLATAESCTGGGIASAITAIPGSSAVFKGAVVAYANEIKQSILRVNEETLLQHGAVSEATVIEMATGVAHLMQTDCAIATSGIAGPGGGTKEKPVGTVWIATYIKGDTKSHLLSLDDCGRAANISATIAAALQMLLCLLRES